VFRRSYVSRALAALALVALPGACDPDNVPPAEVDTAQDAAQDTATPPDTASPPDTAPPEPSDMVYGAVGRVGHIIDGDTLDVIIGAETYNVRLSGINAPECIKGQSRTPTGEWRFACIRDDEFYGMASYEGIKLLAADRDVRVTCDHTSPGHWCPTDAFGRYLAYLEIDGDDLAIRMAWHGYAFSYTTFFSSKRAEICAASYDAREKRRGMWSAGTVEQVIAGMSEQTQSWYWRYHDKDCDAALGR